MKQVIIPATSKGIYKLKPILLIVIVAIFFISGYTIFYNLSNPSISQEETGISQENTGKEIVLVIDNSEGSPKIFKSEFATGITAFDLLKNKAREFDIVLKTKTYDFGIFVEAIGNKENGESGKYWLYYVNGEMPQVASDKKELKAGDRVEFKFEKSSF